MDWVQYTLICCIEFDWFGNQTHTKFGVNPEIEFDWLCQAFSCPHVLVYPIFFLIINLPRFWSCSFSSITWRFMQRKRMFVANAAKALVCQMRAGAMSWNVDSCSLVLVGVLTPQWKHCSLMHGDKCTNCPSVTKKRKKGKQSMSKFWRTWWHHLSDACRVHMCHFRSPISRSWK